MLSVSTWMSEKKVGNRIWAQKEIVPRGRDRDRKMSDQLPRWRPSRLIAPTRTAYVWPGKEKKDRYVTRFLNHCPGPIARDELSSFLDANESLSVRASVHPSVFQSINLSVRHAFPVSRFRPIWWPVLTMAPYQITPFKRRWPYLLRKGLTIKKNWQNHWSFIHGTL